MICYFINRQVYEYYPKEYFKSNTAKTYCADYIIDTEKLSFLKDRQKVPKTYKTKVEFWKDCEKLIDNFDGVVFEEYSENEINNAIFNTKLNNYE